MHALLVAQAPSMHALLVARAPLLHPCHSITTAFSLCQITHAKVEPQRSSTKVLTEILVGCCPEPGGILWECIVAMGMPCVSVAC